MSPLLIWALVAFVVLLLAGGLWIMTRLVMAVLSLD